MPCFFDRFRTHVNLFLHVVDAYREPCRGTNLEPLMQRHAAVMAGAEADAVPAQDFREVVGVDAGEGEGEATKLRIEN